MKVVCQGHKECRHNSTCRHSVPHEILVDDYEHNCLHENDYFDFEECHCHEDFVSIYVKENRKNKLNKLKYD